MTTLFSLGDGPLADARRDEFIFCIRKNLSSPFFSKIVILLDGPADELSKYPFAKHEKIDVILTHGRPSYRDFIQEANKPEYTGQVVCICNTDIFFNDSVVAGARVPTNAIYAITRRNWDPNDESATCLQGDGIHGSSDAWIFRAPLEKPFESEILIGVIGCDSYFCQKALQADIRVFNPCYSIQIYHYHKAGVRNDQPNGLRYWNCPDYAGVAVQPCTLGADGYPAVFNALE